MNILRIAVWTVISLIFGGAASMAAAEKGGPVGLEVYSALNYTEEAGEFYGSQVTIVPYTGGKKILWREAGPRIEPPLLLDLVYEGKTMKFKVLESSDSFGEWVLIPKKGGMILRGPRGLTFDLKAVPFSSPARLQCKPTTN